MIADEYSDDERPANLIRANKGSSVSSWMDNSVNKPLPWIVLIAIVSCTLAGIAIGMQLRNDAVIDAKITAAIAPANEKARTAATDARLALDRADKIGAALDAKGLIKLDNH